MRTLILLATLACGSAQGIEWSSIDFTTASGETVAAEQGTFKVPLHHDRPEAGSMTLAAVRFAATTDQPGPPIVYLAGGPGGSGIGTAKGRRFRLFMAMRQFGDVIALDQRGTGESSPPPGCQAQRPFPHDRVFTSAASVAYAHHELARCGAWWAENGVDLSAFNTWESAGDLDVLRRELGADKLVLWGISYGTHLAMAAVKRLGDERIERLILASPEGLDQTVKYPLRWDGYIERLAGVLAADPDAHEQFPDLVGTLRTVLDQLAEQPAEVTTDLGEGPVTLRFGPVALRYLLAFMGKNPNSAAQIPALVYGIAAGHYMAFEQFLARRIFAEPTGFGAMSFAMDVASGISPERLAMVRQQATTALMGDVLNYPMPHLLGVVEIPDLGESFRAPVASNVPALILTGTLDGRTFPEAHAEVLAQFSNGRQLTIENAGHDLFMVSPDVTAAIVNFMAGREVPTTMKVAPPRFAVP